MSVTRLFASRQIKGIFCASLVHFHFTMAEKSALKDAGINKDPKAVTQDEWKKILTPEQFYVTRQQGTERPHTGKYNDFMKNGVYTCVCCGADLFESDSKFSAHCGWPSFHSAKKVEGSDTPDSSNVERRTDNAHGMTRTEIICKKCGAHLGHVFDDGPQPTGERFCVNSVSLDFTPKSS